MDKNAIKKFAVWARTELIARVSLKGVECGITEDNIEDANADSVRGKVLTADEKKIVTHEAISANIEITLSQGKAEFCCSTAITSLSSNSSIDTLLNLA